MRYFGKMSVITIIIPPKFWDIHQLVGHQIDDATHFEKKGLIHWKMHENHCGSTQIWNRFCYYIKLKQRVIIIHFFIYIGSQSDISLMINQYHWITSPIKAQSWWVPLYIQFPYPILLSLTIIFLINTILFCHSAH